MPTPEAMSSSGWESDLTIFFTKTDLSLDDTLSLGNDGCESAASSQFLAFGYRVTSFFSGSLSLSSSLLDAFPPKFLARLSDKRGPNISIACVIVPSISADSRLMLMKFVYCLVSRRIKGPTEATLALTQNSAALAFGNGSFPSSTSRVKRKKNSAASRGSNHRSVAGRLVTRRPTKSTPFWDSSGSVSGSI